jgi:hypothetical protein
MGIGGELLSTQQQVGPFPDRPPDERQAIHARQEAEAERQGQDAAKLAIHDRDDRHPDKHGAERNAGHGLLGQLDHRRSIVRVAQLEFDVDGRGIDRIQGSVRIDRQTCHDRIIADGHRAETPLRPPGPRRPIDGR